jgi:hypothetical protein
MANKVNITIGRFQPFTQGHLNMIIEGEAPCILFTKKGFCKVHLYE